MLLHTSKASIGDLAAYENDQQLTLHTKQKRTESKPTDEENQL
jgi:hypothetical protein